MITVLVRATLGRLLFALLLVSVPFSRPLLAAPTACPAFFVAGQAPDVLRMEEVPRTHMLCFRFYSAMASGITRTPLWSAERLTADSVAQAQAQTRHDAFHAEMSLLADDRAELDDYRAAGFDRGHMAPSADMPDPAAQEQSFSLANMVPQVADNNRHLWQGIEITTRAMAKAGGELYVVSGPAFVGAPSWIHSRVAIPSYLWKAIYDPKRGAAAYLTGNRDGDAYAVISIALLQRITGIDPFPGLSADVKAQAIALPPPRPSGQRMKTGPVTPAVLGLVFPADGGPAQTTLAPPQPSDRVVQQDLRAERKAAALTGAAAAAAVQHAQRTPAQRSKRAEKRAEKRSEKQTRKRTRKKAAAHDAHAASQAGGVYGYGYALGKTLQRFGNDIGAHAK